VNTNEIIDYYMEAGKIREIERYGQMEKCFRNNVAEHCFMMTILADKLIEHYDLKLDFRKVVRYIYLHDWGEIGMKNDIPAASKAKNRAQAKDDEMENAIKSLSHFGLKNDIKDLQDYENHANDEAKFVFALDKLEGPLFALRNDWRKIIKSMTDTNGEFHNWSYGTLDHCIEFELNYPTRAINMFPAVTDFANAVIARLKTQFADYKK